MDRRKFLIGLFGTAAIAAAGPLPDLLEQMPEADFTATFLAAHEAAMEIYMNSLSIYGFAMIQYLDHAPWIKVIPPEGYKPMRVESDRIGDEAIAHIKREFGNG